MPIPERTTDRKTSARLDELEDKLRVLLQLILAVGLLFQGRGFAADISCVITLVPKEFIGRALLTPESRDTIAREYQRLAGTQLPQQPVCTTVAIVGVIQSGDYDAFASVYRESKGWLSNVALVSYGGNLEEGLRIGRLIRQALLATTAPGKFSVTGNAFMPGLGDMKQDPCDKHECVCASTCFVIWVAGIPRGGNVLGIHRPSFDAQYFGSMNPSTAEKAYERAIQELRRYLQDMAVPQTYYDLLMKTPSWEVAVPWQGIKNNLESPSGLAASSNPTAIDEWLAARCGAATAEELAALEEYDAKTGRKYALTFGTPSKWNELPDPAYRLLAKKIYEITSCRFANRLTVQFERYRNIVTGR